ncbi:MAG TPA: VCBS repeat-containing protein [Armatimonadota bacterium]|nr:VCBS repeat-containing protein [Armatimonadota bacterium]
MSPRTGVAVIGLMLLALCAGRLWAASAPASEGSCIELRIPGLELPIPSLLLDQGSVDVTGDGVSDAVFLVGSREKATDIYSRETWVIVRDGATNRCSKIATGPMAGGYDGEVFLGDFNGDGVADMLVSLPSGGSGGGVLCSIISYRDNTARVVFDQEKLSLGPQFRVLFEDDFVVRVFSEELRRRFDLDVARSRDEYVAAGVYDEAGRLLKKTTGLVDSHSLVQPVDPEPAAFGLGVQPRDGLAQSQGFLPLVAHPGSNDCAPERQHGRSVDLHGLLRHGG